jgi:peptide-methionine (S)-S-oxide reductase
MDMEANLQAATLAGGCFWCLEAVFDELKGVVSVESGYSGGVVGHPSYRDVCTGRTGHAEAVRVTFAPEVLSYRDLLHVFFAVHDPTTLNRQGADVGTQYRSAIFYHDEEQKLAAERVIRELNEQHIWERPIVTELAELQNFYTAEDYHQEYFANNPYQPYCMAVVAPKVAKFRKQFVDRLKKQPA